MLVTIIITNNYYQRVMNCMCKSLQIVCRNPNPQWEGIKRRGLWEVIMSEGRVLIMGLAPFQRRHKTACFLSVCSPPGELTST